MAHQKQLSDLIGEIYDAALDPTLWTDVVGKAGHFVGGQAASIFSKNPIAREGHVYYVSGIDQHYQQLYFGKYIKLDPITTGHYFADVGQPIATADLMPREEFLETRLYKEWVQPQGMVDFVSAVLDKSATSAALFGVFRHKSDGLVDEETRWRMHLVVPHIRRAVLVGRFIDLKSKEAATFSDALDGLSTAICFVDASGRIVHANAACHVILDEGNLLSTTAGRVVARDADIDRTLQKLFEAAAEGDAAIGTQGIALPLCGQDGARYILHLLPLTSGARRLAGVAYDATAAMFLRRATLEVPSPPEVIAKTYKLTPTELRVLLGVVEVGGVPAVSAALGVAETTIKTHLRRLFEKTGVDRQADLVKIVAGFTSPLRG
jgi:DNA-binding CsgD family transcriptional regulator